MHTRRRIIRLGVGALGCACVVAGAPLLMAAESGKYRCPPCNCAMDGRIFDAPGTCPACGMTLVAYNGASGGGESGEAEFEVPENRLNPRSRRIKLRYLRLPSTAARPGNPIVYLAGGPGASGIFEARGRSRALFEELRSVSDVIAFDQRGTGTNNAIPPCEPDDGAIAEYLLTREGMTRRFVGEYRRCRAFWKKSGVDIGGYNTLQNAADLDDLRRTLGIAKLNLLAESYGTMLAFATLKYHGESIDRVVLASIEGLHQNVKRPATLDVIFERVDALLKADPKHREEYPDFLGLMRRVHARLEREPARVVFQPNPDAAPITVVIGVFIVQSLVGVYIKNPQSLKLLPAFYRDLDAGKYEQFAQQLFKMSRGFKLPMGGMTETMDLASGISRERLEVVRKEAKTALLGDALNFPMPQAHGMFPELDPGDAYRAPARFDVPALLIAGSLDGRMPLSEQGEAGVQFRRANWVIVENGGHDLLASTAELRPLLVKFFGGTAVPDTKLHLPEIEFP